jgi:hypothetical protein
MAWFNDVRRRQPEVRSKRSLPTKDDVRPARPPFPQGQTLAGTAITRSPRRRGRARRVGSAGHASATASLKLTFHVDRAVGANHERSGEK